jgi:GxxExxY protein
MLEINQLTRRIIGHGIEVHRHLGPGLPESAYERALCIEFTEAGLAFQRQIAVPVFYKGELVGEYRPDFVVAEQVVVEIKSVERLARVHTAQMLSYLAVTRLELGLVMNFNEAVLKSGIRRVELQRGERTLDLPGSRASAPREACKS